MTNTISSADWAGGMAVDGSASANIFTKSDGMWTQPQFSHGYCGAQEIYGIWSGLGGYNKDRLLQTGTDVTGHMRGRLSRRRWRRSSAAR